MEDLGKPKILYQLLTGILGTALVGCDQVPPDPNALIPTSDWEGVQCENDKMDLLSGLELDNPVDSLSLLDVTGFVGPQLLSAGGVACNTATDISACQADLEAVPQTVHIQSLVTTKGDEVRVFNTDDEVKDFLGQLDNAERVFSWMHVHGMHLSCRFDDSAVIEASDGQSWQGVYTEYTKTCAPIVRERVRVEINVSDWTITETDRAVIERDDSACIGRRPPGSLTFTRTFEAPAHFDALGRTLARHAAYEAASVVAFEHLYQELLELGAPDSILKRIECAADDERRHAELVGMLAKRYGHQPDSFEVRNQEMRDVESIAIDNMKVGCIGESWGALVGLYQGAKAQDKHIAKIMRQVALDEVEHAALSWEIHHWLYPRLDENAKLRVDEEQARALKRLQKRADKGVSSSHVKYAGMPEAAVARQLAEQLVLTIAA